MKLTKELIESFHNHAVPLWAINEFIEIFEIAEVAKKFITTMNNRDFIVSEEYIMQLRDTIEKIPDNKKW